MGTLHRLRAKSRQPAAHRSAAKTAKTLSSPSFPSFLSVRFLRFLLFEPAADLSAANTAIQQTSPERTQPPSFSDRRQLALMRPRGAVFLRSPRRLFCLPSFSGFSFSSCSFSVLSA